MRRCVIVALALPMADVAWFRDNSPDATQPVATRVESPQGLFDVYGNVAEWVWDRYGPYPQLPAPLDDAVVDPLGPDAGDERVARGGAFSFLERLLRSANRSAHSPRTVSDGIGLRPVRTLPAELAAEEMP